MSRDPHIPESRSAAQSELERHFWNRREKFSETVEAEFQREVDRVRERRIRKTGMAAVILYSAFAFADRVMLPDAYLQAWAIRFLLVVPLLLLFTFFVYRIRHPAWREAAMSTVLLICGASLPLITSFSHHPNAANYQTGLTLIILFGNIVLSLRFRSAVVTSVALTILYAFALARFGMMSPEVRFNNWLFCFTAVAISLIANYRMDQDQRRAYLARRREQERNEELSHAVALLEKLSSEDALTQLANRREFEHRLDVEWGRSRREGKSVALIMVDVDCFKNYNDHYGHQAGDACLQQIGGALRSLPQRSTDLVARFGGEEFIVLLPDTDLESAADMAEHMRRAVVDLQIPHAASRVASGVTASFGVAAAHPNGSNDARDLIAAADAALYLAKEKGRNQVAVQEPGLVLAAAARVVH